MLCAHCCESRVFCISWLSTGASSTACSKEMGWWRRCMPAIMREGNKLCVARAHAPPHAAHGALFPPARSTLGHIVQGIVKKQMRLTDAYARCAENTCRCDIAFFSIFSLIVPCHAVCAPEPQQCTVLCRNRMAHWAQRRVADARPCLAAYFFLPMHALLPHPLLRHC